jgi:hypothetical protein
MEKMPPEVEKKIDRDERREVMNPADVEKVEGNLRMTKARRIVELRGDFYNEQHQK